MTIHVQENEAKFFNICIVYEHDNYRSSTILSPR